MKNVERKNYTYEKYPLVTTQNIRKTEEKDNGN